mmetsp:Transcript_9465/g.18752  ORF Transcript_9465/g.18752 Transcript_9465/m.18752 type:complete len:405 (+) Transcript_9465:48-1262(+)|eukprot:CAMPEP_0171495012 /NCGR_PEP_ID=MMETSP0958-20121227/5885_1 /TAXON_ID=87120 /ORGANISM="Aurantiochytrium limacinum, Strain ATCCMYA-1381" /LENGTH=404 /DNA_ID=CAMNT_0012028907 /DNA_START=24 /DNA_END=1238 /DNA_ORIENTATION=-
MTSPNPNTPLVLLYYCYVKVEDPEKLAKQQENLCERLDLKGRVRVAGEGLNGTLAGDPAALDAYKQETENVLGCFDIDWKTSPVAIQEVSSNDDGEDTKGVFPDLLIKVVDNLVGASGTRMGQNDYAIDRTGVHLSPSEFHATIAETKPEDLVLIDVRNQYEYEVGHFKGAVNPSTRKFSDFEDWFKSQGVSLVQGKQKVLMYCTGGIRCETASMMVREVLNQHGKTQLQVDASDNEEVLAQEVKKTDALPAVYQLKGGIHRYLEAYPEGFFGGRNFVFDGRVLQPTMHGAPVGKCTYCECTWDSHSDDRRCQKCRMLVLVCDDCASHPGGMWCAHHELLDPRKTSQEALGKRRRALEERLASLMGRTQSRQRRKVRSQIEELDEAKRRLSQKAEIGLETVNST